MVSGEDFPTPSIPWGSPAKLPSETSPRNSSPSLVDTSTVKLPNSGAGTGSFFTGSGSGATAGTAGTEGMPRRYGR